MAKRKSGKKRGHRTPRPPKPVRMAMAAERDAAARERADAGSAASPESSSMAASMPVGQRAAEEEPALTSVEGESIQRQVDAEEPGDSSPDDGDDGDQPEKADDLPSKDSSRGMMDSDVLRPEDPAGPEQNSGVSSTANSSTRWLRLTPGERQSRPSG